MAEGGETHAVEDEDHETEYDEATPRMTRPLPLNSKRLKVLHVKQTMTLPTSSSSDEVRQMIEGRLADMGKDPRHVQVLVPDAEGAHLQLQYADGVFLDIVPEENGHEEEPDVEDEGEGEVAELRSALREAQDLNQVLQDEVSLLKSQLEKERKRVKEIWYKNCDQLREFDEILDDEIEYLRGTQERVTLEGRRISESPPREPVPPTRPRRGKAPPVDVSVQ